MYYLCGAGVILRIASEIKKRVNAAKIGRFPGFGFAYTPWLWNMLKRYLQRVIWRIENAVNTSFNLNSDESRTRIALSPFSTKNQIDRNVMQRSNKVATKASQNASSVTEPVAALCARILTSGKALLRMTRECNQFTSMCFNGNGGIK